MLAPDESYPKGNPQRTPNRRGVSRRSVIEKAKAEVPTIELAHRLCVPDQMRQVGTRWVAKCPLPGHEDRTPSFNVFAETNSWYCFGAVQVGGDVVDLASHAWGIDNPATAAAEALLTYGHEIPPRPAAWFRKQERQRPVRDAIGRARFELLRRRLYRTCFRPLVVAVEDEEDLRRNDEQVLWEATDYLARHILNNMMGGHDG